MNSPHLRTLLLAGSVLGIIAVAAPGAAHADDDERVTKLIQLLIQNKILSAKQAKDLLRQTEAPKARHVAPVEAEAAPAAKHGEIRVTYVPQFVRKQIADEVRAQVMSQAQTEGWAAPDALPDWTKRFKLFGDLRVRYERDSFDRGNYNQFINYQSINQGSAYDLQSFIDGTAATPPILNTTQDRDRERVRARIGMEALIDDGWTADIRVGTGADQGPVTPNQTLGSPGDFSKYQAYIDRAYFTYQPFNDLKIFAGREPNPFFTTDLIFYSDLGFDGISANYTPKLTDNFGLFLNAGAFPILNTAFDFSTTNFQKYNSANAYLFAIQGGVDWRFRPDLRAKLGVGFFDFSGVQGSLSKPCQIQTGNVFNCSTDDTRFPYEQFGNTVIAIRDIVTAGQAANPPLQPEYFGLASKFAVLDVHPRLEITSYDPINLAIEAEFLKNFGYNRANILKEGPPNTNYSGPLNNSGNNGVYQGGDSAYTVKATLGHLEMHKRWDWNVTIGYRYLETDSTLDSITDSDFHLGGTNAKGYTLSGSLGVARNTYVSLRYFAATVVSGPPDGNQVFQVDLLSSF